MDRSERSTEDKETNVEYVIKFQSNIWDKLINYNEDVFTSSLTARMYFKDNIKNEKYWRNTWCIMLRQSSSKCSKSLNSKYNNSMDNTIGDLWCVPTFMEKRLFEPNQYSRHCKKNLWALECGNVT